MKYVKLFEEFENSESFSPELLSYLHEYLEEKESDITEYLDILAEISLRMEKYNELYAYLIDSGFDVNGYDLLTILDGIHSLIDQIEDIGDIERGGSLFWDMISIIKGYSYKLRDFMDHLGLSKGSSDIERATNAMREGSEMLASISRYNGDLLRVWGGILERFDSIDRLEGKLRVVRDIISVLKETYVETAVIEGLWDVSLEIRNSLEEVIAMIEGGKVYNKRGILVDEMERLKSAYERITKSEVKLKELVHSMEKK
jgi:hypothetical protein